MMKDIYILGIETSCDETSMAIVKNGTIDIATSTLTQMDIHAHYGGVVPEIASRMHTEKITLVLEDLFKKTTLSMAEIDAIAVTYAPGLLGSLLVGLEFAKTLALIYDKPLIKVHHLAGHIYANNLESKMDFPLLALIVSGGHTSLVLMPQDYEFKILGETLDDAIGESFDKVAKILGLSYPGGPNVEAHASRGNPNYELPIPMQNEALNFSYSGLKSAITNLVSQESKLGKEINKNDLACSFQTIAIDQLIRKTEQALVQVAVKNLIVAGGVSANKYLGLKMKDLANKYQVNLRIPAMRYCTDNGTMIAAAAYPLYLRQEFADLATNASSNQELFNHNFN